ncbi:Mediator of RNA polymerase II transcription subunit 6 [Dictyocoela muelleri]|nr:Mediator of RNA polymerase II transcription subunit 6 [Dictyocoela muelleri]
MSYKNEEFLFHNNLDLNTLFDYFTTSPFYDRTCSNEIIKMQTQRNPTNDKLKEMVGIQYITHEYELENIRKLIEKCTGSSLILFKIFRHSYHDFKLLTFYYVVDGFIYEANSDAQIFKVRISNFLFYCNKALDLFFEMRHFDIFKGFVFETNDEAEDENNFVEIMVLKQIIGLM